MSAVELFSTRLVPPQRRHLFWRDVVAETFPGMTVYASEGIRAELARWKLGPVFLARAQSGRAHISRIAQNNERNFVLHLQRRGRLTMIMGDEVVTANAGDIVIADDSRPYAVDISDSNDCLILQMPTEFLRDDLSKQDWHGHILRGDDANVAFMNHILQGLWNQRDMFGEIDEGIGDLLAGTARMLCRRSTRSLKAPATCSPVEFALRHLADPDLGTATICCATGLSPRAVQKAFLRHCGLTPTAFIAERRLVRTADLLALNDGRSITDVALETGFNDAAFFSRCFRRRFETTPSEWRSRAPSPLHDAC